MAAKSKTRPAAIGPREFMEHADSVQTELVEALARVLVPCEFSTGSYGWKSEGGEKIHLKVHGKPIRVQVGTMTIVGSSGFDRDLEADTDF